MTTTPWSEMSPEERRVKMKTLANQTPMNSLVASAKRVTKKQMNARRGFGKPEDWQDDAWDMYDLVGEQRFLATTLAGRLSQAKLYVGKLSDNPTEPPKVLEDNEALPAKVFSYFGDSPTSRAQMIARLGVNLFVAGDGWLVGIPRHLLSGEAADDEETPLDDLDWRMMSVSEVGSRGDMTVLTFEDNDTLVVSPDDIFLIRVWRPHPRKWWQADSPTRASLPVLRELVSLTMHISAQVDSRLAGAGVFIVPQSAKRAIAVASGIDPDLEEDPFTEALMEAMMTAIEDRSSAAAMVPLVITVPDESTGLFQHISFANNLDGEARELRDEAIRRLALGQDAPPELLLGVAGMNHWGAWLVREDVVTTHLEPPLALICDAITSQFLWPVLEEQGMDSEEARQYVVWYDVSHMVQRPNRLSDAQSLHAQGAIGDDALRAAAGFTEEDAPEALDRPVEMAIEMAKGNPALIDNMPEIVAAFKAILNPAETNERTLPDAPEENIDTPTTEPEESAKKEDPLPKEPPAFASIGTWARQLGVDPVELAAWVRESREPNEPERCFTCGGVLVHGDHSHLYDDTTDPSVPSKPSAAVMALPSTPLPGEVEHHATLLYLGPIEDLPSDALDVLQTTVERIALDMIPFTVPALGVEPLGDEGAEVLMLDKNSPLTDVNHLLQADSLVGDYHEKADITRYPEFTPHVTVGYAGEDGDLTAVTTEASKIKGVTFDRLAVWWGDEEKYEYAFPSPDVEAD